MSKAIQINNKTALVSGANRGIGKAIVEELLARGAKKVFLGVRNLDSVKDLESQYGERVQAVELDVSKKETILNLPKEVLETEILVNNAGVLAGGQVSTDDAEQTLNDNLEVNLYGVLRLTNHLLPSLSQKSQAALATIGSVVSFASMPVIGTYSISKAAVHSAIQAYRAQLVDQPVLVTGIYPGPIDTDMAKGFEMDKESPQQVAKAIADGLEAGDETIFTDAFAREAGQAYLSSPVKVEQMFAEVK